MSDSIVFAGTPEVAATVLRELVSSGVPVSTVITKPDAPVGRKRVLTESAVAACASGLGIPVIKSNRIGSDVLAQIAKVDSRLGIVVAYGSILDDPALRALDIGWFNLHFSLLPKFRGPAPVQRALLEGESVTGVTLFRLDSGIDTGNVVAQLETEITPDENASDLLNRLAIMGSTLLKQELPRISSGLATFGEQVGVPSQAKKISRSEARIDFLKTSQELHNQIRACNPEPGAWARHSSVELKIHSSRVVSGPNLDPGSLLLTAGSLLVGCGNGTVLELLEVQPSGKSRMTGPAWYRGLSGESSLS